MTSGVRGYAVSGNSVGLEAGAAGETVGSLAMGVLEPNGSGISVLEAGNRFRTKKL